MNGLATLARKEILDQRRTWKFVAMAVVLALPAILGPTIFAIVTRVRDDPHGLAEAMEALENIGGTMTFLGVFVTIIIVMGLLASERDSGTAAMTLSKPVTRSAFVAAKALGLTLSIFGVVAIASSVAYLLTLILFANGGLARFAQGMGVNATFLLFIGSVAFFWSAMFTR